jgi:hypothetical protein
MPEIEEPTLMDRWCTDHSSNPSHMHEVRRAWHLGGYANQPMGPYWVRLRVREWGIAFELTLRSFACVSLSN